MKIAVLIPDRNDRPRLLENCLRMMSEQTLKPDHIEIINDDPLNDECDITLRYRLGYDRLRNKGFDIIALIENDDWYSKEYLETMVNFWEERGRPNMLGLNHTIYYNIKLFAWFIMHHVTRSSAMNTLIKPDLEIKWCADNDPYTDVHLWHTIKGEIVIPPKVICVGIKHGIGMTGGKMHTDKLNRYINIDLSKEWLRKNLDEKSFLFYSNYFSDRA